MVTCGVLFGARRRARARRRCVPRQLRLSVRSSECCGTREEAHRHNGNANRRGVNNVRTSALFPVGSTTQVSTAINHWLTRMGAAAPGKTNHIVTTATRNGSIAVAGAQVSSTPSVSRVVFLSHTSRCGGRGRGGARSAARRGIRRVSEWAKALGFEVISPAS